MNSELLIVNSRIKSGFSLVEVMFAAGILAIGFMLILTLWPAGIKLTAISTERVIGTIVADEAFAKIRLYGLDMSSVYWPVDAAAPGKIDTKQSVKYMDVAGVGFEHDDYEETRYPSVDGVDIDKKYCWSALVRHIAQNSYQVTVFVSRLVGDVAEYPVYDADLGTWSTYWRPVPIAIMRDNSDSIIGELVSEIDMDSSQVDADLAAYVNSRSIIVDGLSGKRMRVMERDLYKLAIAKDIEEDVLGDEFWVIPSQYKSDGTTVPKVSGRCPCVSVFQQTIDF